MSGVFEILTPHPLIARPLVRGEDTLAGWREGGGVNSSEETRHCSVLYTCKYFVVGARQGEAMVTDIQTG